MLYIFKLFSICIYLLQYYTVLDSTLYIFKAIFHLHILAAVLYCLHHSCF